MANSYRDLKEEGRIEKENRDMDDTVVIGRRSAKTKTYHEMDENGKPKCVTAKTTDNEWRKVTRLEAQQKWNFPCFQYHCKENIDG